jgi:hypothetical protein
VFIGFASIYKRRQTFIWAEYIFDAIILILASSTLWFMKFGLKGNDVKLWRSTKAGILGVALVTEEERFLFPKSFN